jgi:hypothetical protein
MVYQWDKTPNKETKETILPDAVNDNSGINFSVKYHYFFWSCQVNTEQALHQQVPSEATNKGGFGSALI